MAAKSERPFQITVFGATGFTGKHVAEDLKKRNIKGITWAVAGRNETKLKRVLEGKTSCSPHYSTFCALQEVFTSFSFSLLDVGCPDVPIVMADVNDPKSLRDMCSQTQVVISCVGPVSSSIPFSMVIIIAFHVINSVIHLKSPDTLICIVV